LSPLDPAGGEAQRLRFERAGVAPVALAGRHLLEAEAAHVMRSAVARANLERGPAGVLEQADAAGTLELRLDHPVGRRFGGSDAAHLQIRVEHRLEPADRQQTRGGAHGIDELPVARRIGVPRRRALHGLEAIELANQAEQHRQLSGVMGQPGAGMKRRGGPSDVDRAHLTRTRRGHPVFDSPSRQGYGRMPLRYYRRERRVAM
jgi:hypothetical protein